MNQVELDTLELGRRVSALLSLEEKFNAKNGWYVVHGDRRPADGRCFCLGCRNCRP